MKPLKTILQSNIFYIVIILITLFYVYLNVKVFKYQSLYLGSETKFIGQVLKYKKSQYGYTITFKAKEKLIVYLDDFNYEIGDILYIEGDLKSPSNNTILNDFNYKKYLYQEKIFYILEAQNVKLLKKNANLIYKLKNYLLNYMDTFLSGDYLKTFLLGDTSYLNKSLYKSYQINGISHLLSIGSLHITFLSFLILFSLKKLKVKEICSNLILFLIIFLYLLLTSFPIAIFRIFIYLILKFLNKSFNLNLKSLNLFLLTLTITLLINPFYITNKGFLYSYSISFILILNNKLITGNYFQKLLKVSIISFLYSIPLNIYFNYSFNIMGIVYNLIYVPIFNLIVFPLALLTLIIKPLDLIFYKFLSLINNLSFALNNLTFGIIILKKISILILILYFLILTYVIGNFLKNKKFGLFIFSIILIIHFNINNIIPNDFYLTIDVNQGDSSLFSINNKTILIDTGGLYNKNLSEKTITMFHSLGITKIDYLLLSHGDFDHMGESINLVNNFKVSNVVFNCGKLNDLETNLIKTLEKKKIPYYRCIKELKIADTKFSFLNNKEYNNENDNSSVIYTKFNDYKFLFMGDASIKVEEDILLKYDLKDIDILKVGHHGSKTSSSIEFINKIKPKYSIISVGKNNRYNHPSQETLKKLQNSKIYRTDLDGSIMFSFQNNKLKIKNYYP